MASSSSAPGSSSNKQQQETPAYEIKGRTMSLEEWDLKIQTECPVDFVSLAAHNCDIGKFYDVQGLGSYFNFLNGPTYQTLVRHFWVRANIHDREAAKIEEDEKTEIRSSIMGIPVRISEDVIAFVLRRPATGEYKAGITKVKDSPSNEVVNQTIYNKETKGGGSDQPSLEHKILLHFFITSVFANVPRYIFRHMLGTVTGKIINGETLKSMHLISVKDYKTLSTDMTVSDSKSALMTDFPPICKQDPLDVQMHYIREHFERTKMYGGALPVAKSRKTKSKTLTKEDYLEEEAPRKPSKRSKIAEKDGVAAPKPKRTKTVKTESSTISTFEEVIQKKRNKEPEVQDVAREAALQAIRSKRAKGERSVQEHIKEAVEQLRREEEDPSLKKATKPVSLEMPCFRLTPEQEQMTKEIDANELAKRKQMAELYKKKRDEQLKAAGYNLDAEKAAVIASLAAEIEEQTVKEGTALLKEALKAKNTFNLPSSPSSSSSSTDSDDISLSQHIKQCLPNFKPSKTTPSDIPDYDQMQINFSQQRIKICEKLSADHFFQPPIIEPLNIQHLETNPTPQKASEVASEAATSEDPRHQNSTLHNLEKHLGGEMQPTPTKASKTVPEKTVLENQQSYPQPEISTSQEQNVPEQTVLEQVTSDQEQSVPEQTVPEQTVPEQVASDLPQTNPEQQTENLNQSPTHNETTPKQHTTSDQPSPAHTTSIPEPLPIPEPIPIPDNIIESEYIDEELQQISDEIQGLILLRKVPSLSIYYEDQWMNLKAGLKKDFAELLELISEKCITTQAEVLKKHMEDLHSAEKETEEDSLLLIANAPFFPESDYVSRDFKTIQGEIADSLGLQFVEETVLGRANRLRQRIKMEKNILVILDDIWSILDLKKVGIPFGNKHNGCKLLMTSRNQDVLLKMDVPMEFTFKLELMIENETWSLFQFMAGDVVEDRNLKDVAVQVAKKCEGLPLMVVTVARAMKNKRDVQSWKDALRKLQSTDHTEMDSITYSALELSYNSLESDEMKDLFLLFALLLGNDIEYFLKVAMGLDILKHINAIDDARNRLYTIIKSLKATCLLLEVKTGGRIQMHDFVRDFAISIARRDKHVFLRKQFDEEWTTKDFFKRCTQIILDWCCIHELPQMIDCPNIKLFYLGSMNQSLEIPDTFFEGMRSLRVLDLTHLNLLSLPTSFRLLTDLQTLCLDQCVLGNTDAIEALQNLEILRLWKSSMIKLPREIGRLIQLRMLDLSHSGIEVVPPNIISNLTKLEELYMGNTSINWKDVNSKVQNENASIAELRKLPHLTALELQVRETWMLPRDLQLVFQKLERYKVAIGDVWDWSDIKDGTLKTLMLKLSTNIHLEHGIKALVKGVENLYLDDVDGIQNVLYQLNGEGFPLLKHLHVQNNANMKHIVDSKERNQIHVSFPILETLVLLNLKNLMHICHGPLSITSFGSLNVVKVKNCVQLKYLFSFAMLKGLSHLREIEVCQCNSMKEIVLEDNNSCANNDITNEKIEFLLLRSLTLEHLETLDSFFSYCLTHSRSKQNCHGLERNVSTPFFNAQVAFPKLDTVKLSSILNLNQVWDDNHQSMYNLTNLIVDNCVGLKYLFPSTLVESFMNLKHLEISNCPMMEEIIAKKDRNNALKEVHFLKLEKILLKDMDNLKTIWHPQFKTLKMLEVNNCKKIVVVFPSSVQNTYNDLEKLEVTNCALVEEIFELNFNENNSEEATTHLKEVTIDGLLKLKKIWSGDLEGILSFQAINCAIVNECPSLEYLLPLSVATRCSHLKELDIKDCQNMKEIVAEEKESSVNAAPIFEFNQLTTLLLWGLNKLNSFYAGNHTLVCPSLTKIDVYKCTKLNLFRTLSTRSSNFQDDKHSILTQQPLFIAEEVIPNIEELKIVQADADMILQIQNSSSLFCKMTLLGLASYNTEEARFPYWFLENVHTLESLVVEDSCFKKIFQDKGEISEKKTQTQIKNLMLNELPKLQHICEEGSQIDPVLEFLEYLNVSNCSSLTNLMPSSVTLNRLTYLEVTKCDGLKYLITTPTARCLDKLTVLIIKDCNSLEEIITGVENVFDIAFINLETLMLECLPSLVKFCSSKCILKFLSLEEVFVRECPRMKIFSAGNTSTPILRKVKIAENEEWLWKGNLNDTIYNMFEDKGTGRANTQAQLKETEIWANPTRSSSNPIVSEWGRLIHISRANGDDERRGSSSECNRGVKHLTYSDLIHRKTKGLCFCCGERYTPLHQCAEKQLRTFAMELQKGEEEITVGLNSMMLSGLVGGNRVQNALPSPLHLAGSVKGMYLTILVDTGASHNFISPIMAENVAANLHLLVDKSKATSVKLGNGGCVMLTRKS
ncbi:LRR and NB-ARC domain disease resistance protein [Medicago truncatula]|uniref:LRR and NB-ARC domain disease resistance protein n=1 Tax=Medicago truncatula TaxID=3880 RepID=A0A072UA60_MEDTR|nr:LRR and NB-ARC domain disease resistance protein [Medicago truncatula]